MDWLTPILRSCWTDWPNPEQQIDKSLLGAKLKIQPES